MSARIAMMEMTTISSNSEKPPAAMRNRLRRIQPTLPLKARLSRRLLAAPDERRNLAQQLVGGAPALAQDRFDVP